MHKAQVAFPPFFLEIDDIEPNGAMPGNSVGAFWQPPNVAYGNVRIRGHTTGRIFLFQNVRQDDGSYMVELPQRPENLQLYQTVSMYHERGRFFLLDYDVTARERNIPPRRDSLSEDEDDGIHDWLQLGFQYTQILSACATYTMVDGDQPILFAQRPDQDWPRMLLPHPYHTHNGVRSRCGQHAQQQDQGQRCGGMIGQIALLIGLLVFSVKPSHVERALKTCIRHGHWTCPDRRNEEPGRGCEFHIILLDI